jgi:uncharacterized caspase-like protein
MLYYAGHGLQLDWHNYLIPVGASIKSAPDIGGQAVDVESVIDAFRAAKTRMNILVLDACRDNSFENAASGKGLAPMDAPQGTFIAYATAPGNVALDGNAASGHGLYTQYLLEQIAEPKTRIEDVFKRVRLQVRQQSRGRQIPWESTSLEDDFYFDGKPTAVVNDNLEPGSLEALANMSVPAASAGWGGAQTAGDSDGDINEHVTMSAGATRMATSACWRTGQLEGVA